MKNLKIFLAGFYRTYLWSRIYIFIYISSLFYFIWIYRRLTREIVMEFRKNLFSIINDRMGKSSKIFYGTNGLPAEDERGGEGQF